MKKISCILLLFIITALALAQNLLLNPGFESWSGNDPDSWSHDDSILIYQEDIIVHGGNFSVRESLITPNQDQADFFQGNFAVQANTQYDFTIWAYDNDIAGRVRLGVYWYPSGSFWSSIYTGNSNQWQQLNFNAVSPADAESAMIMIRAYDSAATWDGGAVFCFDDASFQAPSAQPPVVNRIWHLPVNPGAGIATSVYAKVNDDGFIVADTLLYGINSLNTPNRITHTSVSNDTFRFTVPGQAAGDTIFYYLRFIDNDGLDIITDTHSVYVGDLNVVINEIFYDASGVDNGCYVEIYGQPLFSLSGYSLVGVNGFNGSVYVTIDLSGHSIPDNGFFVVAQDSTVANYDTVTTDADMQNGPDNVELRYHNITIDALGYGTLNGWCFTGEWEPAVDVVYDHCLARHPDGDDTDNNIIDFHDDTLLTPGEPNPSVLVMEQKNIKFDIGNILNPVPNGIAYARIIPARELYPFSVYNITGQVIEQVTHPEQRLMLAAGIYFIRLNENPDRTVKIIVIGK
ncbi:hypothetical protein A2Y85_04035 [candidate division WOR-3 bacterium RBG_13_43_14]|uniref:LTD domain-containing protein n=1 Tax=candidate division WOR-3 bacterium RBG_13_43_14 TaxID=1802590 RepID=A0A1F4U9P1_UNCW3|nr:MAG: hypothetical protein A2Y85_04035 [candidate division WOR-3 bacterium RBG_13_43_14]